MVDQASRKQRSVTRKKSGSRDDKDTEVKDNEKKSFSFDIFIEKIRGPFILAHMRNFFLPGT